MTGRILAALLAASACAAETPDELRELMRRSLARIEQTEQKMSHYAFTRHFESKQFSAGGAVKSRQAWVGRSEWQEGFRVFRLLERDGKPIPEEERVKIEEGIQKRLAELQAMTPEQLKQRREQGRRRERDDDAWLKEFPDALDYKLLAQETVNGAPALVLECSPRPGYKARNMRARVFEKVRGRAWVDKTEAELVKADVEVFDTVSIGWGILGRIEKGTRFMIERQKLGPDLWLPASQTVRLAARMMLVKSMHQEISSRYSDYRPRP